MCRFTLVLVVYLFQQCVGGPVNLTMPNKCAGMDFCKFRHPDYPGERIEELLRTRIHLYKKKHIDVGVRFDEKDKSSEETVCESDPDHNLIYEIVDNNGSLRFVVQSENFSQRLRTEICVHPGRIESDTSLFTKDNLEKYNIQCVQKSIDYKLLVLTEDGQGFELVSVRNGVPVFCFCRID